MTETKIRYSKQREAIYQVLKQDHTHPNADTIYINVKKEIPDISLGTVYRNLNFLAEQKRIKRLDCGDGVVHFDAIITPHYHMVCDKCGTICDVMLDENIVQSFIDNVYKQTGEHIHGVDLLFHGTCQQCQKKKT